MKKIIPLLFILFLFGFAFHSCKLEKENKKVDATSNKNKALEVVSNAIDVAGTLEKWKNIASLEYTKKSRLLLKNGEIESEVTQRHHYNYRPHKSIEISWVIDKDTFLIVYNDSVSQKLKNGNVIEQGDKVKSTVNSSIYVLGMPFKLLDKGTVLKYEGLKSFNGVDTVHSINATYEPKKHLNHSTKDVWWYHFDKNNGAFLSSLVYHEPTYALIENLSVEKVEGLSFPAIRKSYRVDEQGKKQFLRAEFWYSDYSIEFLNK